MGMENPSLPGGDTAIGKKEKPYGGTQQAFIPFCPPQDDPPHWYELAVTQAVPAASLAKKPVGDFALPEVLGRLLIVETHPNDIPTAASAHSFPDMLPVIPSSFLTSTVARSDFL